MSSELNIQEVLERLENSQASSADLQWLRQRINEDDSGEIINKIHAFNLGRTKTVNVFDEKKWKGVFLEIIKADRHIADISNMPTLPVIHRVHLLKTAWLRYAAAILLIITGFFAYYKYYHTSPSEKGLVKNTPAVVPDILPGSSKVVLTLSDGKKIELNSATSGTITDQNLSIENNNGQLRYGSSDMLAFNTMTTPKGGQYQVVLPDGTKVWLNAASSITYPTAFTGDKRMVQVEGEVYFEVIANAKQPFIVKTQQEEIQVLGTSFNVNAYPDEKTIKTSLLEGSVKINNTILKPGQAYAKGKILATNIEQDVAWKNGVFNFNNLDLQTAMNQISRWYDINVIYENHVPQVQFGGEMGRDLNLSQVLNALHAMGVQFTLDGKNLIVKNIR